MSQLTAIDSFAGAGGLSLGLMQAGWNIPLAFDHDPISVETYRLNLGSHAHVLDAEHVTTRQLMDLAGLRPGECDLMAGGPPCQGFSLQRRGERRDPRNQLSLFFLDWVRELRPKAFLIENVAAITSVRGKDILLAVQTVADELGYGLSITTVNALHYGAPQNRLRTFIVGMSGGREFVWPSLKNKRISTVRDAIGNLPSPPTDGSCHPDIPNHYREARLSATNIARIQAVPEGGARLDLPEHLQLECHKSGHRHLDTYGRLAWDLPAGTITARFDSFTRGRFGHPVEDRSITLREGARLQGFPDTFTFLGNREEGARMIGNAVPPPLARSFASALAAQLAATSSAITPAAPPANQQLADTSVS
jgi:DNA (cytosine-5)-methyltransferase 1